MTKTQYSFRVAFQSIDEMGEDPNSLVLTTLPNGLPSFKTINAIAETEALALDMVDRYVSETQYQDIEDGIVIQ